MGAIAVVRIGGSDVVPPGRRVGAAGGRLRRSAEGYEALVNSAISGDNDRSEQRREMIDEFGWRNFGELYADHESVDGSGHATRLVSHYNNQYDAVAGFITPFPADRRSPVVDRWPTTSPRHVADIDLYHTTRDRAAYNGGYFWHTQHYQPAGTATHRAYSRRSGARAAGRARSTTTPPA